MSDAWYPAADAYWVPPLEAHAYPLRYGDLCATPELDDLRTSKGKLWDKVLVLHPSCELGAKAAPDTEVLVARVNHVRTIGKKQRPAVRVGWAERDGKLWVAHANTFWIPPLPDQGDDLDWYADFRRLRSIPLETLRASGREATMSHEARVYLIRREIYFKYRWLLDFNEVLGAEAQRIGNDPAFEGPRPEWASSGS